MAVGDRHPDRGALRVAGAHHDFDDAVHGLYGDAQLFLFLSTGPINAAIINLVVASERATAIALSVFAIHLLGDALSPLLVGALSDSFSLQQAIKIVPVAVLVGGFVWLWAARAQGASKPVS